jgi:hypothetical protein
MERISGDTLESFVSAWPKPEVITTEAARSTVRPSDLAAHADELKHLAAGMLHHRFSGGDAASYIAWRSSRGEGLVEDFEAINRFPLSVICEARGLPASLATEAAGEGQRGVERVFTAAFEASRPGGAISPPQRVAVGEGCFVVSLHRGTSMSSAYDQPVVTDRIPESAWLGMMSATLPRWFVPPVTLEDLIQRDGSVMTALVAFIIEDASRRRRPMMLACFFDPASGAWHVFMVSYQNDLLDYIPQISVDL